MTEVASRRPVDRVVERLTTERRIGDVRRSGDGVLARCPHHTDANASLSVREGADGRALLHCHAGCATADIVCDLGLSMVDLFPSGSRERLRPRTWKGIVPLGPNGPALESFGDDTVAAMLGEIGRLAHVRGRLDAAALKALAVLSGAAGTTKAGLRRALAAALAEEAA